MRNRIMLSALITLLLLPLWFLFVGAFQDVYGIFIMPPRFFPRAPTLANFQWVFSLPILGWFRNTLIVTLTSVVLAVIVSVSGAFAFAFYKFPFKSFLWPLALAGIMVPRMSMIIPLFVVFRKLGLSGTLLAAILPTIYMPMGLYIARAYFQSIPVSMLESARIDGANEIQILAHIVAPVSRPIVTAIALFAGIMSMGDYLWQLLQLQRSDTHTMLIGLMRAVMLRGGGDLSVNPVGRSLAVAVVLLVPLLLIFLVANKYFTSALGGALKE